LSGDGFGFHPDLLFMFKKWIIGVPWLEFRIIGDTFDTELHQSNEV